jgi:hypothetical protein
VRCKNCPQGGIDRHQQAIQGAGGMGKATFGHVQIVKEGFTQGIEA